VSAAKRERGARAILMAMALFARQTGAHVIAEGIEDEDALRFIDELNDNHDVWLDNVVEGGQGYGLGRPSDGCPAHSALLRGHGTRHPPDLTTAAAT
jgi:EAL domain-containing protein (putative c-di-GMP-specific phosphodiesterase class I)